MSQSNESIFQLVKENAKIFKVPTVDKPTFLGRPLLKMFNNVLKEEVDELLECETVVDVADCFADIIVYVLTESQKWGIPIEDVLRIVIQSQRSKLVNGQPIWAENGSKYLKGPNFVPPEPEIEKLLAVV